MMRKQIWSWVRPFVAAALAVVAWIASMYFSSLFPGTDLGKFLSNRGFMIAGAFFLPLLFAAAYLARLKWWDCAVPVVIPLWIVGFDVTNYWTSRVWLAFVLPIALSVGFAAFLHKAKEPA